MPTIQYFIKMTTFAVHFKRIIPFQMEKNVEKTIEQRLASLHKLQHVCLLYTSDAADE